MKHALAIIDTNILVSGIITNKIESPTCRIVDGMLQGSFSFLLSVPLLKEYREVLLRPAIARLHKLAQADIEAILETIAANAILREPLAAEQNAPDQGDQHLWNLLAVRKEAILITGDKLLLANPPESARVISAQSFIGMMQA